MLVLMTPDGFMNASAAMSIPAQSLEIPPDDGITYATVDLHETIKIFDKYGVCFLAPDEMARREASFWNKAQYFSLRLEPVKTAAGMASLVLAAWEAIVPLTSVPQASGLAANLFAGEIDLSNLEVADIPELYGPLRLESLWGPSVTLGFLPEQSVGAVTFGGRLHLLHMSYAPVHGLLGRASELLAHSTAPAMRVAPPVGCLPCHSGEVYDDLIRAWDQLDHAAKRQCA